jgi:hypothetical protein
VWRYGIQEPLSLDRSKWQAMLVSGGDDLPNWNRTGLETSRRRSWGTQIRASLRSAPPIWPCRPESVINGIGIGIGICTVLLIGQKRRINLPF